MNSPDTGARRVLLVNPRITSSRHARFPLAVLSLSAALRTPYVAAVLDGNVEHDYINQAVSLARNGSIAAMGVTVMGGPQLLSAISLSKAIRAAAPRLPIIWGGAFPTVCPDAAAAAPYVDFVVRSQGQDTLNELLGLLGGADKLAQPARTRDRAALASVRGLSFRDGREIVHNPERAFSAASLTQRLPYERLANPGQYLTHTYLGVRTAGYQAALGCRYRCTFCGVANMFRGRTALPTAARLAQDLAILRDRFGVDGIQFYDHNFFDREVDMVPLLEVLAGSGLKWWCFARSDALADLSDSSWKLVRKSGLRMAYIGAESPSDWLLHDIRKGTRAEQTLAAIEQCRRHGVVPELSFMLAPPQDPEGETERTFEYIRSIKKLHPATEVMIYVYTPLPLRRDNTNPAAARMAASLRDTAGRPVEFPRTADEWAHPSWIGYWCHRDAPWLTPRLRRRIADFTTVLGCRFPTIMDLRSSRWGKAALRSLAAWRYRYRQYDNPWELHLTRKVIRPFDPRVMSL